MPTINTLSDVVDAFQQINGSVQGVKTAPSSSKIPNQLTPDQLPAVITWYGGDDWVKGGTTDFVCEVYVAPVGSASPTDAMARCLALATAFRDKYRAQGSVAGFSIITARHTGRGGFGSDGIHKTLGYSGAEYFGFSFRVPLFGVNV